MLAVELEAIPETTSLPASIDVLALAKARQTEISLLANEIYPGKGQKKGNRRVFQQVPRSMRRRTASHDIRRLPVRLRQKAMLEESGEAYSGGKKCRRWRRRNSNLSAQRSNLRGKPCWLHTHIWHAKRAHMETHWGVCLPVASNEKSLKKCLRAALRGCFLMDASYYNIRSVNPPPFLDFELHPSGYAFQSDSIIGPACFLDRLPTKNGEAQYWMLSHPSMDFSFNSNVDISGYAIFELYGPQSKSMLSELTQTDLKTSPYLIGPDPRSRRFCKHGGPSPIREDNIYEDEYISKWAHHFYSPTPSVPQTVLDKSRSRQITRNESDSNQNTAFAAYLHEDSTCLRLIVPHIWALPIWRALIFLGACFGGQHELQYVLHELGRPAFPYDFPGTSAYLSYAENERNLLLKKHSNTPPHKRGKNYAKSGDPYPFYSPFEQLVNPHSGLPNSSSISGSFLLVTVIPKNRGVLHKTDAILDSTSNQVIGYITSALFSQLRGKTIGFGACIKGNYKEGDMIQIIDRFTGSKNICTAILEKIIL